MAQERGSDRPGAVGAGPRHRHHGARLHDRGAVPWHRHPVGTSAGVLPRFAVADVHRFAALAGTLLVVLHMALLFFDPYAQLRLVDFIVPFLGAYRPLWLGLGTLAFDLLARRDRYQSAAPPPWRAGLPRGALGDLRLVAGQPWRTRLGNGTDAGHEWFLLFAAFSALTVCGALVWRLHANFTEYAGHTNIRAPHDDTSRLVRGGRPRARRTPTAVRRAARIGRATSGHPARSIRLTGRGGAGFPTGRKLASITGRKAVVIGNGAEGEPLSHKDAQLLSRAPHLVLDGLEVAAAAVSADKVVMYVPSPRGADDQDSAAANEASAKVDRHRVTVIEAPDGFVAGEESAVIRRVEGGPALPRDRTVLASTSGVRGRPTLVNNVETLAHVALIARYGPQWFRSVGDPSEPGTMLVTLAADETRSVLEVPTGTQLADLVGHVGVTDPGMPRAVLLGGYHGSWIPGTMVTGARLSRAGLAHLGASPGAGIIHALPIEPVRTRAHRRHPRLPCRRERPSMRPVPQRPTPVGPTVR